jgi:hypothetical protein
MIIDFLLDRLAATVNQCGSMSSALSRRSTAVCSVWRTLESST